ncbi:MAG: type IV toxin-antitoxin system AbiEi family antitoxin [Thermoplasmata archaeon]
MFAPKATRVIRALLLDPRRAMRITDLARECTMSPAGVYWVVRLLEDKGYVGRDSSKRILLTKPKELLDMWAANWTVERNEFKDYFSLEKSPELRIKKFAEFAETKGIQYAFTLMAGASLVAPFVRYQVVWVYVEGDERRIIEGLDLRPVEGGGNIVLVRPYDEGVFQGLQVVDGVKAVSNVQLYVDLYNFRARGREQAEFLRERVIRF